MGVELKESPASSQKLAALGLRTDWEGKRGELHDPCMEQGQMMRHVAEWLLQLGRSYLAFLSAGSTRESGNGRNIGVFVGSMPVSR